LLVFVLSQRPRFPPPLHRCFFPSPRPDTPQLLRAFPSLQSHFGFPICGFLQAGLPSMLTSRAFGRLPYWGAILQPGKPFFGVIHSRISGPTPPPLFPTRQHTFPPSFFRHLVFAVPAHPSPRCHTFSAFFIAVLSLPISERVTKSPPSLLQTVQVAPCCGTQVWALPMPVSLLCAFPNRI